MVEMKHATDQREAQGQFEKAWTRAGGIYVLAYSAVDAVNGVRAALANRNKP